MSEPTYYIHNATRSVHTRRTRAQAAQHPKLTQKLAGGALVVKRGRPVAVSATRLGQLMPSLLAAFDAGSIILKDSTGVTLNHRTGEPLVTPAAASPLPNVLLDSAANDKNPVRPALVSGNVAHDPSAHARGELPNLLKPSLEDTSGEGDQEEQGEEGLEETGDESADEGSEESEESGESTEELEEAPEGAAEETPAAAGSAPRVPAKKGKKGRR